MKKDEPTDHPWNSLDDDRSEQEKDLLPPWLDRLIWLLMWGLIIAITFSVCGAGMYLIFHRADPLNETEETAWARFVIGGMLGVITLITHYQKKPN